LRGIERNPGLEGEVLQQVLPNSASGKRFDCDLVEEVDKVLVFGIVVLLGIGENGFHKAVAQAGEIDGFRMLIEFDLVVVAVGCSDFKVVSVLILREQTIKYTFPHISKYK